MPDSGAFGSIGLDAEGRITAFDEKKGNGQGLVNAGVYVFGRTLIESMPATIPLSLEKDVFPGLIRGRIFAHVVKGPLLDIGSPEGYSRAQQVLPAMMGCPERPAGTPDATT